MNEEIYAVALKNALIEIKNVCPDINKAFIVMDNGTIVTADEQPVDPGVEKAANSLQSLAEKAISVGSLENLLIDSDKGKVYVSQVNGMYSVMELSKRADLTFLRSVTGIILPTILKVLNGLGSETTLPTPLKATPIVPRTPFRPAPFEPQEEEALEEKVEEPEKAGVIEAPKPFEVPKAEAEAEAEAESEIESEVESTQLRTDLPSQQLIVDKFGGWMVRPDTVQLDFETLERWRSLLDVDEIHEVDIETFNGKTIRCKAKVITDQKLEGRGLIRIPEKACDTLELKRGELVRVKPVISEV